MTKRERQRRAVLARFDGSQWRGTRETGVMPNTADSLVAAGWLKARWLRRRRLVYLLTPAGEQALAELELEVES